MKAVLPSITSDLDQAERDLREHGICLVSGVLSAEQLADVRAGLYRAAKLDNRRKLAHSGRRIDHGESNQHVRNTLSLDPVFADVAEHPAALRLVRSVLGWPALLGNQSAFIAMPGCEAGRLHADQGFIPEPWPTLPQGCNVGWCIDEFTEENGATRFVPGSCRHHRPPGEGDEEGSVAAVAPAGTMVVFDSRIWHRTGENRTSDQSCAALFNWYTRPIYRTQENWFLSLNPRILEGASDELLTLLGYKTEGFGKVNGRSPM
ncbi:phytanoyl-CoA dioxygenase family protein [Quisquiliibacterium transsilvanicum]|uniref:Ectoine hydroxylase-related dioxygenase (Phytanoyl-CoA dioxygenase family) n=1 Tax=Quisquiliibacterium transsilvanicum TaxID=1549638 RepID=A0A7W8HIZ0_9BURK|nr:phytanoyl-CoA dioxygenase family protein [Quisquiliibacterium transsilvanicum]MBB5272737.1 ectoine hydroxylase-related dioxygenase (phytanoyl-CoA dioxygenase family) [Quisquiliibacterium transsilvanicum]